ncbi:MAG: tetratricopeptide repeat protein [Deltaproteobacteria bacterium]|nr:tetratricopeptide repeat protein [Deltaproteobacteria bacterium]
MRYTKLAIFIYLIFFLFILYIQFFRLPIFAGDTDIWYHLNSGRYILEKLKIPKDSYFSFITPSREWVDYYWLFQVVVYGIYSIGEYYGLIILRGILFILATWFIFLFLFGSKKEDGEYPFLTMFFIYMVVLLYSRYTLLRPHDFSYLFLVLFLYILELKKSHVKYLPILGVAWANIHGVVYPVMVFIVIIYVLDLMYEKRKNRLSVGREDIPYVLPLLLTATTPFFTPHFTKLMVMPFVPISFAKHYIQELSTFSFLDFTSLRIEGFLVSYQTVVLILLFLTLMSFVYGLLQKTVRARHIVILFAGLMLLAKGKRFAHECFILAIPLIRSSAVPISFEGLKKESFRIIALAVFLILLIIPPMHFKKIFGSFPRYPFSFKNLPHGITLFLREIDAGGYVLNHPNPGGYLQWMLYPKYKIFMDMQIPFLFMNEDMFVALRIFNFFDQQVTDDLLKTYEPSFIIASIQSGGFKDLMRKFQDYRIVFFDDYYVLYVNRKHYPELVKKFELKKLDPYNLVNLPLESEESETIKSEFENILRFHPECGVANEYLSRLYLKKNELEKALIHAEKLIEAYPDSPQGFMLKGEILKEMKSYKRALVYLERAFKLSQTAEIAFKMGRIYFEMGDYERAYNLMVKSINVFAPFTSYRELYYVIKSAILSNRLREATILFDYGMRMIPKTDKEYLKKYIELMPYISSHLQESMQLYARPSRKAQADR